MAEPMINDLRLHGMLNDHVEYFALIGGAHPSHVLSYEVGPQNIRFFFRGNEFILGRQGISFRATGGGFCRYMFGMEQPREDLIIQDIRNRLFMFGAVDDAAGNLTVTDYIAGAETHESVFHDGNAIDNYFFFIAERDQSTRPKDRQALTLKRFGKYLKRVDLLALNSDTALLQGMLEELGEEGSVVFLFRLRNRTAARYAEVLARVLDDSIPSDPEDQRRLKDLVDEGALDFFQQERIRVDTMYRFPQNRRVVDEYRSILVRSPKGDFAEGDQARLRRLRTLAIRKSIPSGLFDTLDAQILGGAGLPLQAYEAGEKSGLGAARSILEGLFLKDPTLHGHITSEDIVRLVRTKHEMRERHDMAFDRLMLDTGKALDDHLRQTNDFTPLERFSEIVTYFDRYDNLSGAISRLAFMGGTTLSQDSLRSIIGSKEAFDELSKGLFEDLFTSPLIRDPYTPRYGRIKVRTLVYGLKEIEQGEATYDQVVADVGKVAREEELHGITLKLLRKRLRGVFPELESEHGRKRFQDEIVAELRKTGALKKGEGLSADVFQAALLDLKKEYLYIAHLLPEIIRSRDVTLREDFIKNSGLDRFHVESLEREFIEEEGLDEALLRLLQTGDGVLAEESALI